MNELKVMNEDIIRFCLHSLPLYFVFVSLFSIKSVVSLRTLIFFSFLLFLYYVPFSCASNIFLFHSLSLHSYPFSHFFPFIVPFVLNILSSCNLFSFAFWYFSAKFAESNEVLEAKFFRFKETNYAPDLYEEHLR